MSRFVDNKYKQRGSGNVAFCFQSRCSLVYIVSQSLSILISESFLHVKCVKCIRLIIWSRVICRPIAGKISSVTDFKTKFYLLWFNLYPRSSSKPNVLDSCGFEHVIVGELSSSTSVGGFHNWIQFYREEKAGRLNYYGYVRRVLVRQFF